MSRTFKSCDTEPPNTNRYVSVMFGTYETAGKYEDGIWLSKVANKIKGGTPDVWCEIDWNDIVFSGFSSELYK